MIDQRLGNQEHSPAEREMLRGSSQNIENTHLVKPDPISKVNPTNPEEVAKYFKERGSRFGDRGFRGTKNWRDADDRVAKGGEKRLDNVKRLKVFFQI